jgi:glycerol kinase
VPRFSSCKTHTQIYPREGWVEHDAQEIYECMQEVCREVAEKAALGGIDRDDIVSIGIANQGETVVAWDSRTGQPLHNAIVWQCKRTDPMVDELKSISGLEERIHEKTGLYPDSYFSALKIKWLIENVEGVKRALDNGTLMTGTLDAFFIYKMTNGKTFATDASTASRTMLFNINTLKWDDEILSELNIPKHILPEARPTCANFGEADVSFCGIEAPIGASAADQQAAMFGHRCFDKGDIKCTYGTGCFILMNAGKQPVLSKNRLLTTIAWQINGKITYALDGGVFAAGSAFRWLKEKAALIGDYTDIDKLAGSLSDNGGVYFVTAFSGLGAPYWQSGAKGMITGLNLSCGAAHVVRAVCEGIAFRVNEVLACMSDDAGEDIARLKADGGVTRSSYTMQFQSDISGVTVLVPGDCEITSKGIAMMAGLTAGIWRSIDAIPENESEAVGYMPSKDPKETQALRRGWNEAVSTILKIQKKAF